MICPQCGVTSPDDAAKCEACGHAFRFWSSFNNRGGASPFRASENETKKSKTVRVLLGAVLLVIFILVIVSSFRS